MFLRTGDVNITLIELANRVKKELLLNGVRIAGDKYKLIKKAGIIGGAGCNDIYEAKAKGCDCLITGEVRLNRAIEARQIGLTLIEANHGIERFVFEDLVEEFKKSFEEVEFIVSDINTDPLYFV